MKRLDTPPKVTYAVHFRTSRGAGGVEHETARAELLAASRGLPLTIIDEHPPLNRIFVHVPPDARDDFIALMPRLGYTEALTRITREFGAGRGMEHREAQKVERWLVGEYRRDDDRVAHELIWRADDEARMERSPHRRPFKMRIDGEVEATLSRRQRRRLSCCDAMVMLNLARVDRGELVVDPFAGIGGIVMEARRMGLEAVCGDIARALAPGLREVSGGLAAIWDASALALADGSVAAVVTEPPYEEEAHADVHAAMAEIARVLAPGGSAVILLDEKMADGVLRAAGKVDLAAREQYTVHRAGGMTARLVVLESEG
ncbi:MAG: TRM11 family SAM-dependent methyltransferase [Armatimonadota bacterium]